MKFFTSKSNESSDKKLKIVFPDWLDEQGIDYRETSTGEIIIESCPACNRSKKLYVEPETGVAQCKYAGCELNDGISPIELVSRLLGISKGKAFIICFGKQEKKEVSKDDILGDDWLNDFSSAPKEKRKKEQKELTEVKYPPLVEDLSPKHFEAWNYLINRGMTAEDIQKVRMKILPFSDYKDYSVALQRMGVSPDEIKRYTKYLNRVIFPVEVDGKLVGYVARDFTNKVPKKYKVMNSEGSFRADVFWNYDNVKESDTIIICEGFMDAIKCGVNRSIAILGADMSGGQFNLLRKLKTKKIIMALDIGTERKQNAIFDEMFLDFPGAIYRIDLPPLLTQKENLLNNSIKKILEEFMPEEFSYFTENEMHIPYGVHDEIMTRLEKEPNWFLSGRNALSKYELENLQKFMKNAEYKDAGDYTKEEMDSFIEKAILFKKYTDFDLNND